VNLRTVQLLQPNRSGSPEARRILVVFRAKDSATFVAHLPAISWANFVMTARRAELNASLELRCAARVRRFRADGLHEAPWSQRVAAPRVAEAYAALECRVTHVVVPRRWRIPTLMRAVSSGSRRRFI